MFRVEGGSRPSRADGMKEFYHGKLKLRRKAESAACSSVHGVVLGDYPITTFVFSGDGEKFLVGSWLTNGAFALAAIVKNDERWRLFPIDEFPRDQRMLRFRVADVVSIFLVVVVLPFRKQFVAMPIAQFFDEFEGGMLGRTVAQRIHFDADRQSGQWIVIFRAGKNGPLIIQPPQIADEDADQQDSG